MDEEDSGLNGSTPPYRHIADVLRGEIRDGHYAIGERIPSQADLEVRFNVSRPTIQRALNELRKGGYIDNQRGRPSEVLSRSPHGGRPLHETLLTQAAGVGLSDHVDDAFGQRHVTIDSFSLTAETLNSALQKPLQRIRAGELRPQSVTIRLLLPAHDARLAVPQTIDDADDDRPRRRLKVLMHSQAVTLQSALVALADSGHVADVKVAIRSVAITPVHKLYVLNDTEVLFGFYEIVERAVDFAGQDLDIYDVLGLDSALFHFSSAAGAADSRAAEFVTRSRAWFDSLWSTIAEPLTLFE